MERASIPTGSVIGDAHVVQGERHAPVAAADGDGAAGAIGLVISDGATRHGNHGVPFEHDRGLVFEVIILDDHLVEGDRNPSAYIERRAVESSARKLGGPHVVRVIIIDAGVLGHLRVSHP